MELLLRWIVLGHMVDQYLEYVTYRDDLSIEDMRARIRELE